MKKIIAALIVFAPSVAFADVTDFKSLISEGIGIINAIVPFLFGLALLAFLWGVIKYIYSHDPKQYRDATNFMVFSIIAVAVMLSIWGLAFLLKDSFFPHTNPPIDPRAPSNNVDGMGDFYTPSDSQYVQPPADIINPSTNV